MKYEDSVLLKIRRDFKESEAVLFIDAELKKAKFELGEHKSLVSELKHKLHVLNESIIPLKKELKIANSKIQKLEKQLTVHFNPEGESKRRLKQTIQQQAEELRILRSHVTK